MRNKSLDEIKSMVSELDPKLLRKDPAFQVGVILLSSALNNIKTSEDLRDFTGYQLRSCWNCLENIKKNGLGWQGKKFIHSGWDNKESGGMAFWLDVNIAMGYIEVA